MIDASMLLHMISALDTLEKLIPGRNPENTRSKNGNGRLSKKPAGPNTRLGKKVLDFEIVGMFPDLGLVPPDFQCPGYFFMGPDPDDKPGTGTALGPPLDPSGKWSQ